MWRGQRYDPAVKVETMLLLTALAAHRLTRLVVEDTILDGPRMWLVNRAPDGKIATLITCPWCAGFWLSGVVVLLVAATTNLPLPLLVWPAVATVVGLLSLLEA